MDTEPSIRRANVKRGKYAISIDPRVVRQVDALVETGFLRSRSHGFEEAARLYLTYHRDRVASESALKEAATP